MNSQQELLEAINTISQNRDRSFDTPATVLRVEGDTVWVHIDGGADETPVNKTISCAEGETVQVRISNGSAFLVGNASAPPTDDKTANVAHFVAEQADEKATEAIKSVNAIEQTVEGKVDSGDSNVTSLSSTMYQNANGVNIYNDTLAVGDSYAHIDGDSFDIKEVTTAGSIDDTNDPVVASFGANESVIRSNNGTANYELSLSSSRMMLAKKTQNENNGWVIEEDEIRSIGYSDTYKVFIDKTIPKIYIGPGNTSQADREVHITESGYETYYYDEDFIASASLHPDSFYVGQDNESVIKEVNIQQGNIVMTGDVYGEIITGGQATQFYKKTPTILTSSSISASATSYTFTDDAITADSVIDIYDTIFGFSPSNIQTSAGSCTVTFPAQSSSHQIKLFVY